MLAFGFKHTILLFISSQSPSPTKDVLPPQFGTVSRFEEDEDEEEVAKELLNILNAKAARRTRPLTDAKVANFGGCIAALRESAVAASSPG